MPIRAEVRMDPISWKILVAVIATDDTANSSMYHLSNSGIADTGTSGYWVPISDDVKTEPTFTVPVEMAQEIMEALVRHFGAPKQPEPAINFAREYTAERERVDKLLDVVTALVENQ